MASNVGRGLAQAHQKIDRGLAQLDWGIPADQARSRLRRAEEKTYDSGGWKRFKD
jgi:hypothetical protein